MLQVHDFKVFIFSFKISRPDFVYFMRHILRIFDLEIYTNEFLLAGQDHGFSDLNVGFNENDTGRKGLLCDDVDCKILRNSLIFDDDFIDRLIKELVHDLDGELGVGELDDQIGAVVLSEDRGEVDGLDVSDLFDFFNLEEAIDWLRSTDPLLLL